MTCTCFPHIQILSTLKNCCYITDQKSMHLAQHLNASINSVFCQAGKENKTDLGLVFSFCIVYLKNIFHLGCRPIEYQQ